MKNVHAFLFDLEQLFSIDWAVELNVCGEISKCWKPATCYLTSFREHVSSNVQKSYSIRALLYPDNLGLGGGANRRGTCPGPQFKGVLNSLIILIYSDNKITLTKKDISIALRIYWLMFEYFNQKMSTSI